jgi:hypothetical protein
MASDDRPSFPARSAPNRPPGAGLSPNGQASACLHGGDVFRPFDLTRQTSLSQLPFADRRHALTDLARSEMAGERDAPHRPNAADR